jgi:polar amino acid transport system substrate-binding protein
MHRRVVRGRRSLTLAASRAVAIVLLVASCADPGTGSPASAAADPSADNPPSAASSPSGSTSAGPSGQPSRTTGVNPSLAAMLPATIAADGEIVIATDPTYAPIEFYAPDNATLIGLDVDLGMALGRVLGTKVTFVKSGFDSIIPGLLSGKYELGMSSFTDTAERERAVDFVTYFRAGTSLLVPKGNPRSLRPEGSSLCGRRVAVMKGSTQEIDDIPGRNQACPSPVQAMVFPDQNAANLALSSGRADAVLADSPVLAYAAQQSPQFEVSGAPYGTAPYGIAVPKGARGLAEALRIGLQDLVASGEYRQILTRWGVASGGIDSVEINAAGR